MSGPMRQAQCARHEIHALPAFWKEDEMIEAKIENDEIVIRLPLAQIPLIATRGWSCNAVPAMHVTDVNQFAKDVCLEMNRAEEDGTTEVESLIDGAITAAFEYGSKGCEEIDDDEAEAIAAQFQELK